MRKVIAVMVFLLLAGAGWAGINPMAYDLIGGRPIEKIQDEPKGPVVFFDSESGVTNRAHFRFTLRWPMVHYRHPWPVRWYDAVVKWVKAHLWWPVGEAEAGEDETLKGKYWPMDFKAIFHGPSITITIPLSCLESFLSANTGWQLVEIKAESRGPCEYKNSDDCANFAFGDHSLYVVESKTMVILKREVRE